MDSSRLNWWKVCTWLACACLLSIPFRIIRYTKCFFNEVDVVTILGVLNGLQRSIQCNCDTKKVPSCFIIYKWWYDPSMIFVKLSINYITALEGVVPIRGFGFKVFSGEDPATCIWWGDGPIFSTWGSGRRRLVPIGYNRLVTTWFRGKSMNTLGRLDKLWELR